MSDSRAAVARRLFLGLSVLILLAPRPSFGQAPALSFEVASIKPAETITPQMIASGKFNVGFVVNGSRVSIGYMSLADLIPMAFSVKPYQVSGPDWMRTQRFDIVAKLPDGGTKEQVPEMLQALLEERFHLKARREQRESSVYALVVGKDGPKMKESPPEDAPPPVAPGATTINAGGNQFSINAGRGGATVVSAEGGTTKIAMNPDGQMRLEMSKMTMGRLADTLTPLLDHPVLDMTGLKGNYQIVLDLPMETLLSVARTSGIVPTPFGPRGEPGRPADASDPGGGGSVVRSVQQLGLRLESRKAPVEFVVVDSVDKTPTEN